MDCPKCTGNMHSETYGEDINVHRCDVCAGLWCTPAALEKMKQAWMAEAVLDIGDPRVGNTLNRVQAISCPEGHGPMLHKSDPRQRHITYEVCPTCHAVFLDAGEFTDLKYDTLLDRVRGLLIRGDTPHVES